MAPALPLRHHLHHHHHHHHHPWLLRPSAPFTSPRKPSFPCYASSSSCSARAIEENPLHHTRVQAVETPPASKTGGTTLTKTTTLPVQSPKEGGGGGGSQITRRRALIHSITSSATLLASTADGRINKNKALCRTLDDGSAGEEQKGGEGKRGNTDSFIAGLQSRICSFSLANGMKWIVLERHNAPVISCYTYATVGASVEEDGFTGLAHLLEHLAFKGTRLVGTRDAIKEAYLLDQLDEVFYSMRDAKLEGKNSKVAALKETFKDLQYQAANLVVPNEYGSIMVREGGIGLNAQTSQDNTEYFVSLPSNKLELWMALESGRFIAPVFRELYSEKEVIKEERRLRVENATYGSFTEAFQELAFPGLSYRRPVIGYPEDFEGIGRREVNRFFQENYNPETLTCAVVGDVNPSEVEKLAEKYFGRWQSRKVVRSTRDRLMHGWNESDGWNEVQRTKSSRLLEMKLRAQPLYMEGYYRPSSSSTDDLAISIISEVLNGGRLSRFYKNIMLKGRALSVTCVDTFPDDQLPCLFLIYGVPSPGSDTATLAKILNEELELLKVQVLTEAELSRVKKHARASFLELLGNNLGMANLLCKYEATTGSYRNLFKEIELLESVTPTDVRRVATLLFDKDNRIKGSVTSSFV